MSKAIYNPLSRAQATNYPSRGQRNLCYYVNKVHVRFPRRRKDAIKTGRRSRPTMINHPAFFPTRYSRRKIVDTILRRIAAVSSRVSFSRNTERIINETISSISMPDCQRQRGLINFRIRSTGKWKISTTRYQAMHEFANSHGKLRKFRRYVTENIAHVCIRQRILI